MRRRFVVQEHETAPGAVHFDLMVEAGESLVTFQLEAPPGPGGLVPGRRSFDHRRRYLDYEGEVSGGRGRVRIWDQGTVEDLAGEPRAPAWEGRFEGRRLRLALRVEEEAPGAAEGAAVRVLPAASAGAPA